KALELVKNIKCAGIINGPISKRTFLRGRYNGITEYLGKKTDVKDTVMLIYNHKLSVSPLTTHIPISKVSNKIKKKTIISKIKKIDTFYQKVLKKKPNIAITGLNPHCESFGSENKEKKEIIPAIKHLRKSKIRIEGPFASDTIFLKENSKKYDVIFGMYHDQVLGPMKTLYGFKAINITIGLPFLRISPDHGPNVQMLGKNKSDPESLVESIRFLEKYAIYS
uniref:4-hydroxythreonine-4-phosphate dehydrogenase PdxA n=1 Tax=Pelagibacter ubique TaxID=198252 RepID=UPI00094DD7FB